METLVKVVDNILVINLRNCITVSEVPFNVVAQGLGRLLGDAGQIPSGLGTRTRRLEVLDEGGAKILPAVDRAGGESFQPVKSLETHHYQEVRRQDVVVAVGSSNGDGVGARPCLGIGLTVELLDADRLEGRGPLDGSQPIGEGVEAVEVISRVIVVLAGLMIVVVAIGARCTMLLVIAATLFPLGVVPLTMTVVDAGS